jgi:DNA repair exonuclease SbcCD ATPase subunit
MRLTAIAVEHFQALIRADVAFGPGLNVIYGPNDFGKSTLAQAIRAALLVVPTSASMSEPFQPWYVDAVPHVTLSFEDDDGHHWRVKKGFETSAHSGSAELYHSKDGVTFTLDVKGRQVEERLRAILGWGIAAPGGKGSPRGLPESFLAQTLLAAQADVDRILGQSLAEDATDSGKVRLGKALATLAQDPLFKKVLDAAQREVDDCYTPTGRRKSGQTSRFAKVGQAVKEYDNQLAQARKREEEATASAAQVTALRARQTEHLDAVTKAQAALIQARERLTRWRAREEADANLRAARATLAQIDARATDVALATADVERLSRALRSADDAHRSAMAEGAAADAAFRAAEDDHRRATSEEGARERELKLAQMEAEHASVSSRIQHVETRRTRLNEALAARRVADDARRSAVVARDELEKATREETKAGEQVAHLESTVAGARMLAEYGHWKAAVRSVREATEAAANAARSRGEADAKDRDADTVLAEVQRVEADLAATAARLTTFDHVRALVQLERDVERTEAALGGGITVVLRPGRAVAVRAVVDQSVVVDDPALASERVLDAERTVRLALGGVLEVDVTAGAAEKRHELATLRARWNAEAVPVLVASGLGSLSAIAEALERTAANRVRVEASRHRVESLRAQAVELRARAALHDDQAAKLAAATRQLEARESEIRGADRASLEPRLAGLGPAWERETAALCTQANAALAEGRAHAATRKSASSVATYRVHDAEERAARASEAAAALAAHLGTADPDSVASSLAKELATLAERQRELADGIGAHTAEATGRAQHAAQIVEAARARVAAAAGSLAQATRDRERILADRSGRAGHRDALQAQLEAMDRSAAAQKVEDGEGVLIVFAAEPPTSEADLQAAEAKLDGVRQALDDVRSELNHAEGAWSKVGGMAVAEEVQRLEEAIESARAREQELEIDAEAYKVLLETLREVENAEGAHLGRALSGPVAARFRELTEGRYGALNLTAALKTEGVQPAGAGPRDVLDALSVGTREQLATLIRLAIAAQLGSAIVLDDQLVHTDAKRFAWFRDVLRHTCLHAQVIVLTCRPEDYLRPDELPTDTGARDLAGGTIRAIDFARSAKRWTPSPAPLVSQPPQGR